MAKNDRVLCLMITVFTVIALAQNAAAQGQTLYSCLGGCYNVCFLLDGRGALGGNYPCYLSCVASCITPQSDLENQLYYCQVGCSAQRCLQIKKAYARNECFGSCGNVCNTT